VRERLNPSRERLAARVLYPVTFDERFVVGVLCLLPARERFVARVRRLSPRVLRLDPRALWLAAAALRLVRRI
jgi:hypothetical protein